MSFVRKFGIIYRIDFKFLRRDLMFLYSVVMMFVFFFIVCYFKDCIGVYYFFLVFLGLIFILMIFGMLLGFMMVDEKEDKMI